MTLTFAIELAAFAVGLLFGSFLNVCIARLPRHESIVHPRSRCLACGRTIRWFDNIPVISWLLLRARCRHCGASISWRYPAVELATGIWLTVLLARTIRSCEYARVWCSVGQTVDTDAWLALLSYSILGFLLIGLLVMDWQTHTLPDAFTLPGTVIGFLLVCTQAIFLAPGQDDIKLNPAHSLRMSSPGSFVAKGNVFLTGPEHLVFGRLAAIVGAALLLYLIRVTYKAVRGQHGLGLGDVKLLAMIAAFLGWWPAILSMFLALVFILPYSLFLLATRRATRTTQLPFGSFLCAGGLAAALFGERVIAWYTALF